MLNPDETVLFFLSCENLIAIYLKSLINLSTHVFYYHHLFYTIKIIIIITMEKGTHPGVTVLINLTLKKKTKNKIYCISKKSFVQFLKSHASKMWGNYL